MQLLDKSELKKLYASMNERKISLFKAHPKALSLFTKTSFFEWLDSHNLDPRMVSFVKEGKIQRFGDRVHPGYFISNTTPLISKKSLKEALSQGASLQMRSLHNIHNKVRTLQRSLIKEFHSFVSINLYYSPAQTKAFNQHFDPYDFMILQLAGEKTWSLGKDKKQKIKLTQGHILFLPAYTYHEVSTQSKDSLHLTIALHRLTMTDLIETLYPQNPYLLPFQGKKVDVVSIQSELEKLSKTIKNLQPTEIIDVVLKTWHRKLSQCFYDESLSEENDPVLDRLEVEEGIWELEQMQRQLIPKKKK